MSDLHIGQDQSVLTNLDGTRVDPSKPSAVLTALMECLADVVGKLAPDRPPTLILLGDAIELALTESSVSGPAFERFFEALQGEFVERILRVRIQVAARHIDGARQQQFCVEPRGVAGSLEPPGGILENGIDSQDFCHCRSFRGWWPGLAFAYTRCQFP